MNNTFTIQLELPDKTAATLHAELDRLEKKFTSQLGTNFANNSQKFLTFLIRDLTKDEATIKKAVATYESLLNQLAQIQELSGILTHLPNPTDDAKRNPRRLPTPKVKTTAPANPTTAP